VLGKQHRNATPDAVRVIATGSPTKSFRLAAARSRIAEKAKSTFRQ